MIDPRERRQAAAGLRVAESERRPVPPLTDAWPDLDLDDAYEIQRVNVATRIEGGATVRGYKVGLTSKAMQSMLGVDEPDFGHLLDDMFHPDGGTLDRDAYCAPRAEPEVAFVLGAPLRGPGVTAADVLAATEFLLPALEIIDSRVADWKIRLPDTIADNASSAGVVLGGRSTVPAGLDLRLTGVVLRRNGEVVEAGAMGAVLGSPVAAVAWLADTLARFDVTLPAGSVVLPGSPVRAVDAEAGDVIRAEFDGLGSVSVRFR